MPPFVEALETNGDDAPSTRLRTCFESLRQRRSHFIKHSPAMTTDQEGYSLPEVLVGLAVTSLLMSLLVMGVSRTPPPSLAAISKWRGTATWWTTLMFG